MRLKDRIAVVTGGGGGLGEGICLSMAKEGAHVVVSDIKLDLADKTAAKVEACGQKSLAIQTDVRKADDCRGLIETALKEMGGLDILVCCAGTSGKSHSEGSPVAVNFEDIPESEWDLTMDVNLKGTFLCCQAAVPHFREQKAGKIIIVSSVGGRQGSELLTVYAASKAGAINLGQSLAMQMAACNVNVNTICPGIIMTPMWAEGTKIIAQVMGTDSESVFNGMVESGIAFKRAQKPEDIGNTAVFLASDEASEITGQALNVCGGMRFN